MIENYTSPETYFTTSPLSKGAVSTTSGVFIRKAGVPRFVFTFVLRRANVKRPNKLQSWL